MHCEYCGSINLKSLGVRMLGKERKIKYKCGSCSRTQHSDYSVPKPVIGVSYVVTSATDSFPINKRFLAVLKKYCAHNSAKLAVIPVNNKQPFNEFRYSDEIKPHLVSDNINLGDDSVIMGSIHLGTTLENPLGSLNSFSKGKTVILGHPQIQMRTLPRKNEKYPPIMTTTGSVSIPNYGENKTSQKANFNHSFSAVFISGTTPRSIRHLNYDGVGFYDLGTYYTEDAITVENKITAIVTGDEHVMFYDKEVFDATYGKDGIVAALKPDFIVRHDVLDCYSISHHHKHNVFTRYAKNMSGIDSIERELNQTLKFIEDTTPEKTQSIIVPSNHNSHLFRWLNEADPKVDLVNAKIYHKLMWLMLDNGTVVNNTPKYPDPFELYSRELYKEGKMSKDKIRFLTSDDDFLIHEIDVNNHGDLGVNGAKGNRLQFKDLPNKSIVGHSHSPGINAGCYQVGTSSNLRLEYNKGLSSWHTCHCIIHKNGKRQLVFLVDGKWK
jgi:hypothetical protein